MKSSLSTTQTIGWGIFAIGWGFNYFGRLVSSQANLVDAEAGQTRQKVAVD